MVCKKLSDCDRGYMDLYRIISRSGRVQNNIAEGYKINTIDDFIKIDNIISKHKFKIFCVDGDTFCKKHLGMVLTTLYDRATHRYYIIFPVSYRFYEENYESTLSEEEQEYIVTLKCVERMLMEKCVYKQFPLELLFRINFKIDEKIYPKEWPKGFKDQLSMKLSNFLKRQFVFIRNSTANMYPVPYKTLELKNMDLLKDYIMGYPFKKPNFDSSVGAFSAYDDSSLVYTPFSGTSTIAKKLYDEKKIT